MKFKLDENFGARTKDIIENAGHDVETVFQENLQGASDRYLYEICCKEQRCLITLDLDFSDVTRFPPEKCGGVIVIRMSRNPSLALLENMMRQAMFALEKMTLVGGLWIVEAGRIRVHQNKSDA